ncbi:MAG: putative DNA binding domain-containing protein [Treponema sp.]|nr:putative DNA binding domain-containing protein [Treponema sp.]
MLEKELIELITKITERKSETSKIEFKSAKGGAPEKLYDSFSSFSNTEGGIIIFGIDEKAGYKVCGIQNPDDLAKKIVEQAKEMEPVVRPLITFCEYEGKTVAAAEIAEMDSVSKPCYYTGKGKSKGSYIRVGDADLPMTEYEIYSYDAFKYKTEDELRTNKRIDASLFDQIQLDGFIAKAVSLKPNLVNMDKKTLITLNGLADKAGNPTVCGIMLFGKYPQYLSPNLDIVAVVCASNNYAEEAASGERFLVNKRLDGTIVQMLESALSFVQQNMKISTVIDESGHRNDVYEYPVKALREIILNALIHRDYSIHTENEPIRIEMYPDRIEVSNPGGLYGRLTIEELGKTKSDVRNPFIAAALEILNTTENRYSGIPTIYAEMKKAGLLEPKFENIRGTFKVTLYNKKRADTQLSDEILAFCMKPRSKETLAKEFGFDEKHPAYFIKNYIIPLIEEGKLRYTIPEKPKSKNQQIVAAASKETNI